MSRAIILCVLFIAVVAGVPSAGAAESGPPRRTPWTASRVTGSPDAPLPYRLEPAFSRLKFTSPVDITAAPSSDRLFVVEQLGKIHSFKNDPASQAADLFLDLKKDIRGLDKVPQCKGVATVFALTFHPDFAKNQYCYVCYELDVPARGPSAQAGSRVSRFTVVQGADGVPRCDPDTEVVVISWLSGGHNGCCLKFGPDGFLYISTGDADAPSPPDSLNTGQNLDDLMSCILRIDVNREAGGNRYAIPQDNPFVKMAGARPEIWAYGLRNPWRMSFDGATGELWIGDVGWELWEMVYRGAPGANYGWSITEGPQPVRGDIKPGPTPIVPPALTLPHSESMSVTGGYVYRGKQFPELVGHYVFGDWETRWLWASEVKEGGRLAPYRRIARTDIRIIGFAEDHDGELLVLGYDDGGVHRIVKNEPVATATAFPRRLSETGLFESVARQEPAAGVERFAVNVPQWLDGLVADRMIAVPGTGVVGWNDNKPAFLKDSVLARTLRFPDAWGGSPPRRAVETQLLHFDGRRWNGYSYRWNDAQTDAELVDAGGASTTLTFDDATAAGARREFTWQFASRSQCMTCHNTFADVALGYHASQLDLPRPESPDGAEDQLTRLRRVGLFPEQGKSARPMAGPNDPLADVDTRARSYLHANCAHCHRVGGGGSALIDLRFDRPPKDRRTVGERPTLGTFDLDRAQIVAPGDPSRSVLLYRMAKTGRGRMPHIGSQIVDRQGLLLVEQWIRQMPGSASPAGAKASLHDTSGALALAMNVERGDLSGQARERVLAEGAASPKEFVRDLFERFAPCGQAARRLGLVVDVAALLAIPGDAARGRQVFFGANGVAAEAGGLCSQCHKVGGDSESFGPDLSHVGTKYDRRALLDSILEPSKTIDPQFVTYVCRTKKGQDFAGLLVEKTAERVVLRDAQKHDAVVPAADVLRLVPQTLSSMPESLLIGLTPQQAADLLEFLAAQK